MSTKSGIGLVAYDVDDDSDENESEESDEIETKAPTMEAISAFNKKLPNVCLAPAVDDSTMAIRAQLQRAINPHVGVGGTRELKYNARYEDLFAPEVGPVNPFKLPSDRRVPTK